MSSSAFWRIGDGMAPRAESCAWGVRPRKDYRHHRYLEVFGHFLLILRGQSSVPGAAQGGPVGGRRAFGAAPPADGETGNRA